jgi:hypothetical protein
VRPGERVLPGPRPLEGVERRLDVADKDPLRTYRGKRDFDRTKEPRGRPGAGDEAPRFVVQIHDASTMHFDFRLQVGDVPTAPTGH